MTRHSGLAAAVALVVAVGSMPVAAVAAEPALECVQAANEGQQKRQAGKFLEARTLLARCSQADCPAAVQTDCGEWSMQLSTRMPSLAFGVLDHAGTEVVDAELRLDGRALPVEPGLAVEMDPGVHEVEARGPRDTRATARFVAHEGERSRKIELRLSAPVLAAAAPAPRSRPLPLAPMAVGGAGLIVTGLGVGFVVAGATSYGNLKDTCAPSCTDDVVDSARTRSIAGDVLLGTGLVTLAAAGVWLFFATRSSATPPVTTAVRF